MLKTLEGSTDTATVQFIGAEFCNELCNSFRFKNLPIQTYTTSAIPFGAALSGNGTGSHYWGNIYNLTGACLPL
jgi:hypothetical protein